MSVPTNPQFISRTRAVAEVFIAFAGMHVAMRGIKSFTAFGALERANGFNVSPGLSMIAVTVIAVMSTGMSAKAAGLHGRLWEDSATAPSRQLRILGTAILCALWAVPLVRLPAAGLSIQQAAAIAACRFFAVGFGEEIFFRGFIQSRLNLSFGRPYSAGGAQFGMGLFFASTLFGFLHALNSVDYFVGRWTFDWLWGAGTLLTGLLFGYIRERSGGVLLGALIHAGRGLLSPVSNQ